MKFFLLSKMQLRILMDYTEFSLFNVITVKPFLVATSIMQATGLSKHVVSSQTRKIY